MKKQFLMVFFVFAMACGVYGQTRPENWWILGTWTDGEIEFVFYDNGSGRTPRGNFNFSINQTSTGSLLTMFYQDGGHFEYVIHRINDRHIILDNNPLGSRKDFLTLNKKN